jgi:hypothetical protein
MGGVVSNPISRTILSGGANLASGLDVPAMNSIADGLGMDIGGRDYSSGVTSFGVNTGVGSSSFDASTGMATSTLSPELQALFGGQLAQAGGFFNNVPTAGQGAYDASGALLGLSGQTQGGVANAGATSLATGQGLVGQGLGYFNQLPSAGQGALNVGAGLVGQGVGQLSTAPSAGQTNIDRGTGFLDTASTYDPFAVAEEQFNRLDAILEPGRTSARTGTAAGLLSTGRLGSTGGARAQSEVESAIERERQMMLGDQFQIAQNVQDQMVGRGSTLTQLGLQERGQAQDIGTQNVATGLGVGQFGMGQQAQTADIGSMLLSGGLSTGQFGLGEQSQQQMLASQQLQDALQSGAFGLSMQTGQQGLGTTALQNAMGLDAQQQAQLGLGSQLTKTTADQGEQGMFESILQGGLTAGFGALLGGI